MNLAPDIRLSGFAMLTLGYEDGNGLLHVYFELLVGNNPRQSYAD